MKHAIAHATFREAVTNRNKIDTDVEEVATTSVHLPQWIRECVVLMEGETNLSESKLLTYMINHGTSMIEVKYGHLIDEMKTLRSTMINSRNVYINGVAMNLTLEVDESGNGGKRRTVRVPEWCENVLGQLAGTGLINYSSMVRLSICFSLSRNGDLREDRLKRANRKVARFDDSLRDYMEFCNRLVRGVE